MPAQLTERPAPEESTEFVEVPSCHDGQLQD